MKLQIILLLNAVSVLEAWIVNFLIGQGLIVCNLVGIGSFYDVIALIAVKNLLILGMYQMYFWSQRNYDPGKKVSLRPSAVDRWVPAIPQAYWVYSPFYYAVFDLAYLSLKDYKITILNAWIMLMHACFWFLKFPTGIREEFRKRVRNAPMDNATRFVMDLVHDYDSEDNVCPSMHCAFSMFIAFIIYPFYPYLAVFFPTLIAFCCLVCKQHLIIDIVPGFALGGLHGWINMLMN